MSRLSARFPVLKWRSRPLAKPLYCAVALCRIGNKNFDPTKSTNTVSSRSKRLAGRKRQWDEESQAKEICPRKLDFEDSIETCVDFSADVTSVNHDHLYFCNKEQATPKK